MQFNIKEIIVFLKIIHDEYWYFYNEKNNKFDRLIKLLWKIYNFNK